jgi:hypothetical protein
VVHGCVHGYGVYVQLQQRFGHRPDVTVQVRKGSACHWLLPWLVASGVLPPNRRAARRPAARPANAAWSRREAGVRRVAGRHHATRQTSARVAPQRGPGEGSSTR